MDTLDPERLDTRLDNIVIAISNAQDDMIKIGKIIWALLGAILIVGGIALYHFW